MNKDIFEGEWKQMRGQAKEWWGKLTDDDLEQVAGRLDKLVGLIQQKYGFTREEAETEIDAWIDEYQANQEKTGAKTPS
jgi:uncharacterized protein YjbJ (UPF0337 family)